MALVVFGLGLFTASQTRDGYSDGKMPLVVSSRISPFVFDRFQVPAWFWAAMAINVATAAGLVVSGVLLIVAGPGA